MFILEYFSSYIHTHRMTHHTLLNYCIFQNVHWPIYNFIKRYSIVSILIKYGISSDFEIHNSKRFFIIIISIHNGVGIIESQSWNWQNQWKCSYNTLISRNYGHRRFYFDYKKKYFPTYKFSEDRKI
jgi:hypothetical protein